MMVIQEHMQYAGPAAKKKFYCIIYIYDKYRKNVLS